MFDLLLNGGKVVDPGGLLQGLFEVAITGNRIAVVDKNSSTASAFELLMRLGRLSPRGFRICIPVCITAPFSVDSTRIPRLCVGGNYLAECWLSWRPQFSGFREWVAKPAAVRLYLFLIVSSIGLTAPTWELSNLNYCDVDLCAKSIEQNLGLVVGT